MLGPSKRVCPEGGAGHPGSWRLLLQGGGQWGAVPLQASPTLLVGRRHFPASPALPLPLRGVGTLPMAAKELARGLELQRSTCEKTHV